jgi:hypothetical protein
MVFIAKLTPTQRAKHPSRLFGLPEEARDRGLLLSELAAKGAENTSRCTG